MRWASSIYSGFLKESITGVGDIYVMLENGTLTTVENISEDEFIKLFNKSKEEFYDMIGERVLEEDIYGI